jgi:hypothetical protein
MQRRYSKCGYEDGRDLGSISGRQKKEMFNRPVSS